MPSVPFACPAYNKPKAGWWVAQSGNGWDGGRQWATALLNSLRPLLVSPFGLLCCPSMYTEPIMNATDVQLHRDLCLPPRPGSNMKRTKARPSRREPSPGAVRDPVARRTPDRHRFLTPVGDPSDPEGLFVSMERYLEHLGVKGHTPMGIHNVERYLRAFMHWCEPLALARPAQIAKADVEAYQRYLFHHRKAN